MYVCSLIRLNLISHLGNLIRQVFDKCCIPRFSQHLGICVSLGGGMTMYNNNDNDIFPKQCLHLGVLT